MTPLERRSYAGDVADRFRLPGRGPLGWWLLTIGAGALLTVLCGWWGLPSPAIFAGLGVAMAVALVRPGVIELPGSVASAAFAVIGVITGQLLTPEVIRAVAADGAAVATVLVGTLAASIVGGLLLAAFSALDRPTAVLGSLAGGAQGAMAVAEEAGAESSVVAIMQYLRVLLVLFSLPVLIGLLASDDGAGAAGAGPGGGAGSLAGLVFCVVAAVAGTWLARLLRIPTAALLGPMALVAVVSALLPGLVQPVPAIVPEAAFLVIGIQVGLGFRTGLLRLIMRSLPAILAVLFAVVLVCTGFAGVMAVWTGRPFLDCYLATTPGGISVVVAAAVQIDGDTAYVTSVQVLRVFMMLLAAPTMLWFIRRRRAG